MQIEQTAKEGMTARGSTAEQAADNRSVEVQFLAGRLDRATLGTQALAAEHPALNRVVRVRVPRVSFGGSERRHWSSSGEDTAPVMRRRGFESHPVPSVSLTIRLR